MINPPKEDIEQINVVEYLKIKKIPHFAPINENNHSGIIRQSLISFMGKIKGLRIANGIISKLENKSRSMGKSKGFPDLIIPRANKYYHGLYIEMKRSRKTLPSGKKSISHTKISDDQLEWDDKLRDEGYCVVVAYGFKEAVDAIDDYMDNVE